jgi:phytoene synthase
MMTASLTGSFAYCERITRGHAGNFYHAFRVLPTRQRRAMCALYAFLRITDDLTDDDRDPSTRAAALADWRQRLDQALVGHYSHRLHPALHQTMQASAIPRRYLDDVLDGVAMDLHPVHFESFTDLYPYCYRVASAVGLACIHIWGFDDPRAMRFAESAGIAFQLTNILRDIREDAARGRIYLPAEDLRRFDYDEDRLRLGVCDEAFKHLMQFEVERARSYYAASEPLANHLPPAGRAVFMVMRRTYCGLLDAIEDRDYDVFSCRVAVSRWRKLGLAVQALPVRWGWQ